MNNNTFFDVIDTEEKAYWLGFFYADGCLYSNGKTASILFSSTDDVHLIKFADIFGLSIRRETTYHKRVDKFYNSVRCMLYSKHLCDSLLAKGVTHRKTSTATGEILKCVPDSLIHHFIRGYFDGDGHIGKVSHVGKIDATEHRFVLCGTRSFLLAVSNLMASKLGLRVPEPFCNTGVYRLQWGGAWQLNRVREWLYKDASVYLERKKERFDSVPKQRGTSQYQGVSWLNRSSRWISRIYANGKLNYIGTYINEVDAAKSYDDAAKAYYGDNACLNFPVGFDVASPEIMSSFIKGDF